MNFLNGACMTIVATLVIGCDDTPVGSSSSRSIVGNWGSTIVQESATNTATMDVEFGFNDDLSMTTKLLLKQLIQDTNYDGTPDTLNQDQITKSYTAFGMTNPTILAGSYTTTGSKLYMTSPNGNTSKTDSSSYTIAGKTLTITYNGEQTVFTKK